MAIVAKMIANEVSSQGGQVFEPCDQFADGAMTAADAGKYGLNSYYGRPPWIPEAAHYRQVYGTSQVRITLGAVSARGEDDPNREWAQATPIGQVTMTIANPAAWREFEAGAEYRVTIQKVRGPRKAGEE